MSSLQRVQLTPLFYIVLLFQQTGKFFPTAESKCTRGCPLALASYYVWDKSNLTFIANALNVTVPDALSYNPEVPDGDRLPSFIRLNLPFPCDCIKGEFLGHMFQYTVQKGDSYKKVANTYYANLTTVSWIQKFNGFSPNNLPEKSVLKVPVNCSCGNKTVSDEFGLFLTYPLRQEDSLSSVARYSNSTASLLQMYNPGVNFSAGSGLVFIPAKDNTGKYPSLSSSAGLSGGSIAGITVAVIATLTVLAAVCFVLMRRKKMKNNLLLSEAGEQSRRTVFQSSRQAGISSTYARDTAGNMGVTIDKSVEFSYEELAQATNNFSMANKIGQGGFGAVYFAELRGEKAAIKKMDMQASKEFIAEINVLTRVHHLNLVRLIGYCVEQSLFLVYEYVDNGNLSQHLRGSGKDPLSWSTRVQIALDSARGLEYIHEHTVPVYVHRDIKSANILIDNRFHAKVADFGLTKLTEVGAVPASTRLAGTFGYMPPEYANYGEVSPKVDVYAFGVVLYELVSAKEAVVKENASAANSKGLVGLFEDILGRSDPDEFQKLVDPRLGDAYPLSSVLKMAQLAKACTHEEPKVRPSMRSVVVALMTMSSTTEEWDVGKFCENHGLKNLMSEK